MKRILFVLLGAAMTVVGLFALNYTAFHNYERHTEWAAENGFPAPNVALFYVGAATAVLGAVVAGLGVARRSAAS